MREVTDPRTGISTDDRYCDYLPNSGQLKVYCDEIRDRRARYQHLGSIKRTPHVALPPDNRPGRLANIFVHADAPQYQRAMELIKDADPAHWKADENGRAGIWISLTLLEGQGGFRKKEPSPIKAPSDDELRKRYAPLEVVPEAAE